MLARLVLPALVALSASLSLDAQAHRLSDHDIIEIAGVKMEFFSQATSQ